MTMFTIANLTDLPDTGFNITDFGGAGDGVTDNHAAFIACYNAAILENPKQPTVYFPAGTFYFATQPSITLPTTSSLALVGLGADVTALLFASGTSGPSITVQDEYTSVHVRDLSFLAGSAGAGIGLTLTQSAVVAASANTAQSEIINCTFRGSDGYAATNHWTTAVKLNSFSVLNFINDYFVGSSASAAGTGVGTVGTSSSVGVITNFMGCTFNYLQYGFDYGTWTQGVTFAQCNFLANTYGIHVAASLSGLDQLGVHNCQFGVNASAAIYDATGVADTIIQGNYFITGTGQIGVDLEIGNLFTINGNSFRSPIASAEGTGVKVTASTTGGVIVGNSFWELVTGTIIGSSGTNVTLKGNSFVSCTTNVTSANGSNNITGIGVTLASVTGAVSGTGGVVELTVSPGTTGFVDGQSVLVAGVGGVGAVQNAVATTLTVVDGTHLLLNTIAFSGSYTSGGFVSALP